MSSCDKGEERVSVTQCFTSVWEGRVEICAKKGGGPCESSEIPALVTGWTLLSPVPTLKNSEPRLRVSLHARP